MRKNEIKWLWNAWKGNRKQAALNASLGMLDVVVQMAQVWATKHAIDVATHDAEGSVWTAVGLMALLTACWYGILVANSWVRNILGVRAQNRMQQHMLDALLHSQWQGRNQMHSGDVTNRLVTDVKTVVTFLTETLPTSLSVITLFLSAFFYLFTMDRVLAVIVVSMLPFFILLSKIYTKKMRVLNRDVRQSDSLVQSILQESVQNRMLVKAQVQEGLILERLENVHCRLRANVRRKTKFSVFSQIILNSGFSLTYIVAFLWAALRLSAGTLTFGGMTAFLQLVMKVQIPARHLTRIVPQYVDVLTAAERLMQLENRPMEVRGKQRILDGALGIRLEDVTFAYSDEENPRDILEGVNFDFRPGTCSVILGETGSGKTTLLRLILAFFEPNKGKATIYNNQVEEKLSPLHRQNFVYVPQGNTLMSGTIRENLQVGKTDATEEEMVRALKTACAEFVFDLPDGIDTSLSEDGIGLSEGQAQRLSIARALLRDGGIMIFDEATSAVDGETEEKLLNNILADNKKTVIFVTHRQAACRYSDNILSFGKQEELSSKEKEENII